MPSVFCHEHKQETARFEGAVRQAVCRTAQGTQQHLCAGFLCFRERNRHQNSTTSQSLLADTSCISTYWFQYLCRGPRRWRLWCSAAAAPTDDRRDQSCKVSMGGVQTSGPHF